MGMAVTLLTLYNHSHGLFSKLDLPPRLTRDTMVNSILMECGEFQVIYPNPEVMRDMIGIWSARNIVRWSQMVETTHYTYNPLYNYDRTEEHVIQQNSYERSSNGTLNKSKTSTENETNDGFTEKINETGSGESHTTETRTPNLTDTNEYNSAEEYGYSDSTKGDVKKYRSGYNAPTEVLVERDNTDMITSRSGDTKHTGNDTLKRTGRETIQTDYNQSGEREVVTGNDRLVKGNSDGTNTTTISNSAKNARNAVDYESIKAYGNIGVTTTQHMIQEQREVIDYNVYDIIVQEFKRQFCIMVY